MELQPRHLPDDNRQHPESSAKITARKASRAHPVGGPDDAVDAVLAEARRQLLDQPPPSASAELARWFAVGGPRAERNTFALDQLADERRRRGPLNAVRAAVVVAVAAAVVAGAISAGSRSRVVATPDSRMGGVEEVADLAGPSVHRARGAIAEGSGSDSSGGSRVAGGWSSGPATDGAPSATDTTQAGQLAGPGPVTSPDAQAVPGATPPVGSASTAPAPSPGHGTGTPGPGTTAPPASGRTTPAPPVGDVKVQLDYYFARHRRQVCVQRRAAAPAAVARPCGPSVVVPTVLRPYLAAMARRDGCVRQWQGLVAATQVVTRCGPPPVAAAFGVIADPFRHGRSG
jgi:hypothetical protein